MRLSNRISCFGMLAAVSVTLSTAQVGLGVHPSIGVGAGRAPTATGGRPFPIAPGYAPPTGLSAPAAAYTGIRPGALNSGGSRSRSYSGSGYYANNGRRGRSTYGRNRSNRTYPLLPFGYFAAPYYYPWLDTGAPYGDDYGPDYPPDDSGQQASMMAETALGQQLARLSAQIDELRNNQQNAQVPQAPQAAAEEPPSRPTPPITLVLRSGEQVQVRNYAVMNQTFWDFTRRPAKQIPISQIDVQASAKATEASGGDFPAIGSSSSTH